MDIDGASIPNSHTVDEIDQNLLVQFSRLNTSDREELITQMQILLGAGLSYEAASFFLDMNNWNLQGAICCYLDFTIPTKFPSMSLKASELPTSPLSPGACFELSWHLANTGVDIWPSTCKLMHIGGESFKAMTVYLPSLSPGQSTTVSLQLVAPTTPGTHKGFFHLMTEKNEKIGDTLWVEIQVEPEVTVALAEQLAALSSPSSKTEEPGQSNNIQSPSQDENMC